MVVRTTRGHGRVAPIEFLVPTESQMKYIVTIQHPSFVHLFRHAIRELQSDGHSIHVFCKDDDMTRRLLDLYGIDHEVLADKGGGLVNVAKSQIVYEARLLARARRIRPDVMASAGGTAVAHVAPLVGARSVVFSEAEFGLANNITFPFADEVWTPECFTDPVRTQHVTYPGYHELAYLHPNRFEPDPSAVEAAGVDPDETYVVLRLSAWDASHDVGEAGLDDPRDAVERLEEAGARVLITAEDELDPALADRSFDAAPHQLHDVLAFADLTVGEGAATVAESAVLGTPAIYVNTIRWGFTDELDARYGLVYNFQGAFRHHNAMKTAIAILEGEEGGDWERRRERLLADKCDVTDVVLAALLDEPMEDVGDSTDAERTSPPAAGDQ